MYGAFLELFRLVEILLQDMIHYDFFCFEGCVRYVIILYEYHCKDLGDSYYEVEVYILHYFAASDGGDGSTHYNNGAYKNKTEGQLVDIVRNKTLTPDIIEKHMSTSASSKTITDYVTQKSVVIYISDKIKHEGYFYGITRK